LFSSSTLLVNKKATSHIEYIMQSHLRWLMGDWRMKMYEVMEGNGDVPFVDIMVAAGGIHLHV
jgi:hypothetical protein